MRLVLWSKALSANLALSSTDVALDLLQIFFHHSGRVFVIFGITLIFAISGALLYAVLPLVSRSLPEAIILASFECFFVFNIYLNYVLCISTDPGRLPRCNKASKGTNDCLGFGDIERGSAEEKRSYCVQCKLWRPKRAHHCSICRQCVDSMDHHCPWIDNCIGFHNYRYFVSFLLWVEIGCIYGAILSYDLTFVPLANYPLSNISFDAIILSRRLCQFVFMISVFIAAAVSVLIIWHSYLIATAQTSIEYQIHRVARKNNKNHPNPNDTGSLYGNVLLVYDPLSKQATDNTTSRSTRYNIINVVWSVMFPKTRKKSAK